MDFDQKLRDFKRTTAGIGAKSACEANLVAQAKVENLWFVVS